MSTDDARLSPHFQLREFRCPCGCATPPEAVEALTALCDAVLEPLRAALGVALHIHSGYRCLAQNRRSGGAKASQHMLGTAADVRCDRPHEVTYAAAKRIQERRGRGGVGKYSRFTHVDNRRGKASWQG